jgi:hypothetical protein
MLQYMVCGERIVMLNEVKHLAVNPVRLSLIMAIHRRGLIWK